MCAGAVFELSVRINVFVLRRSVLLLSDLTVIWKQSVTPSTAEHPLWADGKTLCISRFSTRDHGFVNGDDVWSTELDGVGEGVHWSNLMNEAVPADRGVLINLYLFRSLLCRQHVAPIYAPVVPGVAVVWHVVITLSVYCFSSSVEFLLRIGTPFIYNRQWICPAPQLWYSNRVT